MNFKKDRQNTLSHQPSSRATVGGGMFVMVMALILLSAETTRAQSDAPATPPLLPALTFTSPSRILVWVRTNEGEIGRQYVGKLPSPQPVQIPACICRGVEPIPYFNLNHMDKLVPQMQAQSIFGLALEVIDDDSLAQMKALTGTLQVLSLRHTNVTDAQLANMDNFTALQMLDIGRTPVNDAGVASLKDLKKLQWLSLYDDNVTDASLDTIAGFTELQQLDLTGTNVTDAGLAKLKGLTHLQRLVLTATKITDAGLAQLDEMKQLQSLSLTSMPTITDAGLAQLKDLTGLKTLVLWRTHVTDAGVAALKTALPSCKIDYCAD